MSAGPVKGVVELLLKTDRFTAPAKQVGQDMQTMGQKSKTVLTGISTDSRTATGSLQNMGVQGKAAFQGLGASAQTATTQVNATAASMNTAKIATVGMVGSVAGLTASFVGLEASISNIPKRINAITKAEVGLERAQNLLSNKTLALQKTELALTKAREGGKKTAEEIAIIETKLINIKAELATATTDAAAKQEDLNLKHSDYQDTLKLFATSIATTFITAGSTVFIMLAQMATAAKLTTGEFIRMKLSLTSLKLSMLTSGTVFKSMIFNVNAFRVATIGATFSLKGLKAGLTGIKVAMGPIGWALIGVTAAFGIWENNMFGVQDRLAELWEWLKKILPVLGTLETLVSTIFPEAAAETVGFSDALVTGTENIDTFNESLTETSVILEKDVNPGLTGVVTELKTVTKEADKAGKSMENFKKKRDSISTLLDSEASFSDRIKNRNGIFSQTGRQLVGFRETAEGSGLFSRILSKIPSNFGGTGPGLSLSGISSNSGSAAGVSALGSNATRSTARYGGGGSRGRSGGHSKFRMDRLGGKQIAFNKRLQATLANPNLAELTGLDLEANFVSRGRGTRNVDEQNRRALRMTEINMQRAIANVAEANKRYELSNAILAINPNANANLKQTSESLGQLLSKEKSTLQSIINNTNLSQNQILELRQTEMGNFDLSNIIAFSERIQMEANTI